MDREKAISDLTAHIEQLPEDQLNDFLERHRGSFRVTLVPGYRTETLFGRPIGCSYPYVLHASGRTETSAEGEFEIDVAHLLHCVGSGAPMPGGLRSPVETGTAVVPGTRTVATGTPVTVVTGSGEKAALFTATPDQYVEVAPDVAATFVGWRPSPPVPASRHQKVRIRSFRPDGTILPGASFSWHVTLEVKADLLNG